MSETLEFPEIESAPRTEIAAAAADALDLTKIDLKDVALAQFGKWREKSAAARKTLTGVQHDLSTQAKIDDAKSLRHRLINVPLADARKVSKALKSKLNTVSGEVGTELVKIEADYAEVALLITPQIEAREAEIAEEKRIAAEKEAERIAGIQAQIDIIRGYLAKAQAPDMTSARIQKGVELVEAMVIGDEFAELKGAAEEAKRSTLAGMLNLRDLAKAREDEAARLEAQRIENDRIAAEQAAQAERLAAQQRALDEQAAKIAAAQKAIDDAKAEAERKEREQAEANRLEAEREKIRAEEEAQALRDATAAVSLTAIDELASRTEVAQLAQIPSEARPNELAAVCEAAKRDIAEVLGLPAAAPAVAPAPVAAAPVAVAVVARVFHPAAQALRNEQPTLKLGEIQSRLKPVSITADGLAVLGFEPAGKQGAATLYRESDWLAICQAISAHVLARTAEAVAA